ncbi:4113_t:CDS:2 [Cetraspora pellucida]|uniref:4113_t:CDS:1 n=1 Tax=Cetraspora pellucida TaxID=1433469 RepID=A0A9N8WBF7_9GLOM|nr:4113_t:CDS:2 [Cetraspora pellucida]
MFSDNSSNEENIVTSSSSNKTYKKQKKISDIHILSLELSHFEETISDKCNINKDSHSVLPKRLLKLSNLKKIKLVPLKKHSG